jgi:hypothetical protein
MSEVQRQEQGAIVPASKATMMATASPVSAYLAAHGVGMNGTYFKFSKDGKFVKSSDDEEIPEGTEFVVIYDQAQGGWVKFMGRGNPPVRKQGPLFAGFVPPSREELGDTNESEWEEGLSGKPADPWQFQLLLPLQDVKTGELFIFQTTSITGRRAVDRLIQSCARMMTAEPEVYPVIKLRITGFDHRDERVGWVKVPAFERVGKTPKPDTAMVANGDPNDEVPF